MKNKGLIIGGVAIVALGAFFWMRKKNQMAEEEKNALLNELKEKEERANKEKSKQ